MPVTVIGYLILVSIDFTILFLRFILSFTFDWENESNTKDSVWPHFSNTVKFVKHEKPRYARYASNFQLFSRCLEMWSNAVFRVWYRPLSTSVLPVENANDNDMVNIILNMTFQFHFPFQYQLKLRLLHIFNSRDFKHAVKAFSACSRVIGICSWSSGLITCD